MFRILLKMCKSSIVNLIMVIYSPNCGILNLIMPLEVFYLFIFFLGDAGSFIVRLSKGLKGHRCPEEWPQSLKAGDSTKEDANR